VPDQTYLTKIAVITNAFFSVHSNFRTKCVNGLCHVRLIILTYYDFHDLPSCADKRHLAPAAGKEGRGLKKGAGVHFWQAVTPGTLLLPFDFIASRDLLRFALNLMIVIRESKAGEHCVGCKRQGPEKLTSYSAAANLKDRPEAPLV